MERTNPKRLAGYCKYQANKPSASQTAVSPLVVHTAVESTGSISGLSPLNGQQPMDQGWGVRNQDELVPVLGLFNANLRG